MDDISDLINELPAELNDGSDTGAGHSAVVVADEEEPAGGTSDEEEVVTDAEDEEDISSDGTDEGEEPETPNDEDDQNEYIVDTDEDDDDTPTAPAPSDAIDTSKITQDEFVLAGLTKLTVQVIGPDDKVYTVQAYGNGDLPRDMKGFASKYEEKVWDSQVMAQEAKARELIQKYTQAKSINENKAVGERWARAENRAIRDDLNDLIREGIFPKFKGAPGSKEFDESPGGQEFDKVIKYMQEKNQEYSKAAEAGRAYRHIGFREAYAMLNGPNPKAAEKAEDKARKVVAKKLKSGGGTKTTTKVVSSEPVNNLTDLGSEFAAFVGSTQ